MKNKLMSSKNLMMRNGFTLLELLVVIAIIGILVALSFPNFFAARQRARDAARKSDVKQIQKALELVKSDTGNAVYPTDVGGHLPVNCSLVWSAGTNTYMQKVPCDPIGPTQYYYQLNPADSSQYTLGACLENGADSDRDPTSNTTICPNTSTYSYTLTQP